MNTPQTVERWGLFELACPASAADNPFEVGFGATFRQQHRAVRVRGFYDGDGVYRVRFAPDSEGLWSYETYGELAELHGVAGEFRCTPPSTGNHGPVAVAERYHFRYADGTPYYQIGTTCYAWAHQGEALEQQTLRTLATAPFNKLRMCVFPKHYRYNANEPEFYPFVRQPDGAFDWTRFDPAFWRHFERRVAALQALGIEADLILFHPYDRWGFSAMPPEADERYLRYVVARLAAYRNVWWSLANEYDLMPTKTLADWDRFFRLVQAERPLPPPALDPQLPRLLRPRQALGDAPEHPAPRARETPCSGASSTASRWSSTSATTRATSPKAGATSRQRDGAAASGKGRCAAAMWATARPIWSRRRVVVVQRGRAARLERPAAALFGASASAGPTAGL